MLLTHYKNCPLSIAKIMAQLLDTEVHPQFKSPILPSYYVCGGQNHHNHGHVTYHPHNHGAVNHLDWQMGNMAISNANDHSSRRASRGEDDLFGADGHDRRATGGGPERRTRHARDDLVGGNGVARGRLGRVEGAPASDSGSSGNSTADSADSTTSSSRRPQPATGGGPTDGASATACADPSYPPFSATPPASSSSRSHPQPPGAPLASSNSYPFLENFLASSAASASNGHQHDGRVNPMRM
jgi:hypothetical protein